MPRGREALCDQVLDRQQVLQQQFLMRDVMAAVQDNESAITFLARLGLLRNRMSCAICGNSCRLNRYAKGIDGFRWRCHAGHSFTRSLRADSFFSQSHLSLRQVVTILYYWSRDFPQKDISSDSECAPDTIVHWCNFIREVCEQHLEANPQVGNCTFYCCTYIVLICSCYTYSVLICSCYTFSVLICSCCVALSAHVVWIKNFFTYNNTCKPREIANCRNIIRKQCEQHLEANF